MCYNYHCYGGVAHLGERDIRIVEVTGSSPAVSTIKNIRRFCGGCFFILSKGRPDAEPNRTTALIKRVGEPFLAGEVCECKRGGNRFCFSAGNFLVRRVLSKALRFCRRQKLIDPRHRQQKIPLLFGAVFFYFILIIEFAIFFFLW